MPSTGHLSNYQSLSERNGQSCRVPKPISFDSFLNTYPFTTDKCSSNPSQSSSFLQQMETITKAHNWSECKELVTVGCPTPVDAFVMQHLHPRLGETVEVGQKDS